MEGRYPKYAVSTSQLKRRGAEKQILLRTPVHENTALAQKIKRAPSCMMRMFPLPPAGPVIVPAVVSPRTPPE